MDTCFTTSIGGVAFACKYQILNYAVNLRFSERSLATQMALVFGVLTTLLALLLSVSFGEMLRGRIRSDAGAALRVIANTVAQQFEAQLRTRSDQATVLARAPALSPRSATETAAPRVSSFTFLRRDLRPSSLLRSAHPAALWATPTPQDPLISYTRALTF